MLKVKKGIENKYLDEILFINIMKYEDAAGKKLNEDEFFDRFMLLRSGAKSLLESFSDKYDHELDSEDLFKSYSSFYEEYSPHGNNRL